MSEQYTLLDTEHRSGALPTAQSSGSCPYANRIACRAFTYSSPGPSEVRVIYSKTSAPLLDRPPLLVPLWLASGLQGACRVLCLSIPTIRHSLPLQDLLNAAHYSLHNIVDVAALIDYLECCARSANALHLTVPSCRAVALKRHVPL